MSLLVSQSRSDGRGTGTFLDVYNEKAGTSTDVFERIDDIKINKYNSKQPYSVEQ
jgi:hypothetical protein